MIWEGSILPHCPGYGLNYFPQIYIPFLKPFRKIDNLDAKCVLVPVDFFLFDPNSTAVHDLDPMSPILLNEGLA